MQVYRITNILNGKIYIGQDTKDDPTYFGSGNLITRAIKKYGKENFTKDILCECATIEELNEKEIYFIALYKSQNRGVGYNLTAGGFGSLGYDAPARVREKWSARQRGEKNHNYGKKHPEEVKAKISATLQGREITPEAREKISSKLKGKKKSPEQIAKMKEIRGEKHYFYGKHHTPETKAKLRAIKKEYVKTPEGQENLKKLHAKSGKYVRKTPGHMKGRKHTEEARRNMSLSKLGKKHTPEQLAKRKRGSAGRGENHHMYGKKLSLEQREKLSIAQKKRLQENPRPKGKDHWNYGRKQSPENIEKIRATHTGKVVSEETRAKISATLKRKNQEKQQNFPPPETNNT